MRRSFKNIPVLDYLVKTFANGRFVSTRRHTATGGLSGGDRSALDKLLLVSGEVHQLAHRYMSRERSDHTLQTTTLVAELITRMEGNSSET